VREKKYRKYLSNWVCFLLACFLFFSTAAQNSRIRQDGSQPKDTAAKFVPAKKIATKFVTEKDIDRSIALHFIDTNPNGVEIFHNLYKNFTVFQDLGNIGTPSRPLIFNPDRNIGFRLCENPFEGYWMKPEETKYYNTKTPYTDLFYTQGSNEMLYLLAKHSQNITPRWNIGADLQRITSIGFFARQYTSIYNYQFFTSYITQNRKYEVIANATWNRGVVEESGGIKSDSVFESLTGANKTVTPKFPGYLGIGSQTRFKGRTAFVKQYLHFGKLTENIEKEDTIYSMNSHSQLSLSTKFEEVSYIFENLRGDTNSLLLPNQFYDTTANTFDSTYYGKIENRIAFDHFNSLKEQLSDSLRSFSSFGLTHTVIVASQNAYVRNYQNIIVDYTGEMIDIKNYSLSPKVYGAYNLSGYNAGDYKFQTSSRYRLPKFDIGLEYANQLFKPDFLLQMFKSNQFIWENNYTPTNVQQWGFHLSSRKFRNNFHLTLNAFSLNNWIYINTLCIPVQTTDHIMVYTAELKKTFQVWKLFFDHTIIYQSSNNDVIRVPELSGRIRYYFQSKFKTMKFQLGFDVFYNTAYKANNYNPATRMFFMQNDRLVGNYPVIDPFVSAVIKRATIFAKYEHANQDLFGNNGYYYTQNYPISLASFRFGLRWRFYD